MFNREQKEGILWIPVFFGSLYGVAGLTQFVSSSPNTRQNSQAIKVSYR
ncbi:MAG: hypothetical protein H6968_11275 [Chromatiaceae bacterium]|nr:hypothetical protein [Chromatiaceae bacterium]